MHKINHGAPGADDAPGALHLPEMEKALTALAISFIMMEKARCLALGR